ncbi:MAG: glycosyltransferase family protein [Spirochaetota bacterium]|nr:glycosyltransferase family protein [Spirochaetota bacterium]
MKINGIVNGHKIKPHVSAIIQARMQSKRLPGKVMLDLNGKPLLSHIIERSTLIEGVDTVVVATPTEEENLPIIDLAHSMGVRVFTGSMDNVLERYYMANQEYNGDYIIRVTGDNPFIDIEYATMALDIAIESGSDLCAIPNLPLGVAVEVIKREALEKSYQLSTKPYHREHVTTFIKEHTELFKIERPLVDINYPSSNLRLTVDTIEDYQFAQLLYANLYRGKPFPLLDIIDYVHKNPKLAFINNGIKQRSSTHFEALSVK